MSGPSWTAGGSANTSSSNLNQPVVPVLHPPLPIRGGLQLNALRLNGPGVRDLLNRLIYRDCNDKTGANLMLRLMRAYTAQQSATVRYTIDGWKDAGFGEVKYALVLALDEMSGHQNDGSGGALRHEFDSVDYHRLFRNARLLRKLSSVLANSRTTANAAAQFEQYIRSGSLTASPPPTICLLRSSAEKVVDTSDLVVRKLVWSITNEPWALAYANLQELRDYACQRLITPSGSDEADVVEAVKIVAWSFIQLLGKDQYVNKPGGGGWTAAHGSWFDKQNLGDVMRLVEEGPALHRESSLLACRL